MKKQNREIESQEKIIKRINIRGEKAFSGVCVCVCREERGKGGI